MENEILEKILAKLDKLDKLEDKLDKLEDKFDKLEDGQTKLEANYKQLNGSVAVIENTSVKHVQLLKEGHEAILQKLDRIIGNPPIEERVDTLEYTVSLHGEELKQLRQA